MNMLHKSPQNQTGFTAIETILAIIIIAAIAGVGFFVWHSKQLADKTLTPVNSGTPTFKKHAKTKTPSTTTTTKLPNQPVNPYAGWTNDCDSASKTCLYYPSAWTAQTGLGNEGINLASTNQSTEAYEDPNSGSCNNSLPDETAQLYVVSVSSVTSGDNDLKIVGGYFFDQLNGSPRYNPSYILTNSKYVEQYGVKAGSMVTFPDVWACYDYGIIGGEVTALPVGSKVYNDSTQDAASWFNTDGAKTSLQILQSVHSSS